MIGGIYGKERTADHRHHGFDGGLQAKDIFADLIIEKFLQNRPEKALPKRERTLYNEHSVPANQGSSGLCGENG